MRSRLWATSFALLALLTSSDLRARPREPRDQTVFPYRLKFTEPNLDKNGQPLGDLASCTVHVYDAPTPPRNLVEEKTVPASRPAGGTPQVVALEATGDEVTRSKAASATCVDTRGNVSAESNIVALDFRGVPPAAITDLSVEIDTR